MSPGHCDLGGRVTQRGPRGLASQFRLGKQLRDSELLVETKTILLCSPTTNLLNSHPSFKSHPSSTTLTSHGHPRRKRRNCCVCDLRSPVHLALQPVPSSAPVPDHVVEREPALPSQAPEILCFHADRLRAGAAPRGQAWSRRGCFQPLKITTLSRREAWAPNDLGGREALAGADSRVHGRCCLENGRKNCKEFCKGLDSV